MLFIILMALTTMSISFVGEFFSVYGLAHTFASSFWPVVFMGGALGAGKLMTASYLFRFWSKIGLGTKSIGCAFVFCLMILSSLGIYGYLASAYQSGTTDMKSIAASIELKKQEQATLTKRKEEIDNQIAQVKANDTRGKQRLITQFGPEVNRINDRLVAITAEIQAESQKQITTDSHVGPIVFVAKVIGVEADMAISILILLIVAAFDPLSIYMTIATNRAIASRKLELAEAVEAEAQAAEEKAKRDHQRKLEERRRDQELNALNTQEVLPHNSEEEQASEVLGDPKIPQSDSGETTATNNSSVQTPITAAPGVEPVSDSNVEQASSDPIGLDQDQLVTKSQDSANATSSTTEIDGTIGSNSRDLTDVLPSRGIATSVVLEDPNESGTDGLLTNVQENQMHGEAEGSTVPSPASETEGPSEDHVCSSTVDVQLPESDESGSDAEDTEVLPQEGFVLGASNGSEGPTTIQESLNVLDSTTVAAGEGENPSLESDIGQVSALDDIFGVQEIVHEDSSTIPRETTEGSTTSAETVQLAVSTEEQSDQLEGTSKNQAPELDTTVSRLTEVTARFATEDQMDGMEDIPGEAPTVFEELTELYKESAAKPLENQDAIDRETVDMVEQFIIDGSQSEQRKALLKSIRNGSINA